MKKLAVVALPFVLVAVACGGDDKPPPKTAASRPAPTPAPTTTETTSAKPSQMAVNVDEDIIKACNLKFDNVEDAPKFDFDSDQLTPGERNVLEAVAKCLTTGPLKGRIVELVGRADPRGGPERTRPACRAAGWLVRPGPTHAGGHPVQSRTRHRADRAGCR